MNDAVEKTPGLMGSTIRAFKRNFRLFLIPMGAYAVLSLLTVIVMLWKFGDFVTNISSVPPGTTMPSIPDNFFSVMLPVVLISWLVGASIMVRLFRIVLFEDNPAQLARGLGMGRPEMRYLGYSIVWYLAMFVPYFIFTLVGFIISGGLGLAAGGESGQSAAGLTMVLFTLGGIGLMGWIGLRLILLGPSAAADVPDKLIANMKGSWRAMKGHVWEMTWNAIVFYLVLLVGFVVMVMILIGLTMATQSEGGFFIIHIALQTLLMIFIFPLMTTWVATAYRLYGGPLPEIGDVEVLSEPEGQEQDVNPNPDADS